MTSQHIQSQQPPVCGAYWFIDRVLNKGNNCETAFVSLTVVVSRILAVETDTYRKSYVGLNGSVKTEINLSFLLEVLVKHTIRMLEQSQCYTCIFKPPERGTRYVCLHACVTPCACVRSYVCLNECTKWKYTTVKATRSSLWELKGA